jgi:hypothetical protein
MKIEPSTTQQETSSILLLRAVQNQLTGSLMINERLAEQHQLPNQAFSYSSEFQMITPKMTLYVLKLLHDKWYVGTTSRPFEVRYQEHASGRGSEWTKLHPPIASLFHFSRRVIYWARGSHSLDE